MCVKNWMVVRGLDPKGDSIHVLNYLQGYLQKAKSKLEDDLKLKTLIGDLELRKIIDGECLDTRRATQRRTLYQRRERVLGR